MDKFSPPQPLADFLRTNTTLALAMESPGFVESMNRAANLMESAYRGGKKLIFCGNGGSASNASHFAQDFNKGYTDLGLPAFRSLALTDSVATITALSNDDQYDQIFARQIEQWADPGDILIALSGSGNSPNILKAVEAAKHQGLQVIGLTGNREGSQLRAVNDVSLIAPTPHMQHIENAQAVVLHGLYLEVLGRLVVDQAYGNSKDVHEPYAMRHAPLSNTSPLEPSPISTANQSGLPSRSSESEGWCPLCGSLDALGHPLERRHPS